MISTITQDRVYQFAGLSTDTKPILWGDIPICNGSRFKEIDTGNTYIFNGASNNWVLQPGCADLPEVTSDDDGKVLKVVDGEWAKGEVSGGNSILIAHVSYDADADKFNCDKTYEEISEVIAGGGTVTVIDVNGYQYPLTGSVESGEDSTKKFSTFEADFEGDTMTGLYYTGYIVNYHNSWEWFEVEKTFE